MHSFSSRIAYIFISCVALSAHAADDTGSRDFSLELQCGSLANLTNSYGPFDYTNPSHVKNDLPVVERYHFSTEVENLVQGMTGSIYGDLNYTLRAFPNHHKALNAMARLELRDGVAGRNKPASCYFERAIRFNPADPTVRLVYGIYLYRQKHLESAVRELDKAVELAPNFAEAHYNLGLVLNAAGRPAAAVKHAALAMELGYPLPGLIRKLERAGYWPPPETESVEQDQSESSQDENS